MGLSIRNGWMDKHNRVYIYFTLEDVTGQMNCKNDKAVKMLAELDTVKGVGLIERVKQGQGKPSIIYVRKFTDTAQVKTTEKPKSALRDSRNQDYGKSECNKTDCNNTESNKTKYPSINPASWAQEQGKETQTVKEIETYRQIISENIDYDVLCERYGAERVDEIVELMLEAAASSCSHIRIAGGKQPTEVVKGRMLKLDASHVEYVFECLDNNPTKVRNIRGYLLTTLYNAPSTISSYYRAEVNHGLYGEATRHTVPPAQSAAPRDTAL
jgi:hypothetical protein